MILINKSFEDKYRMHGFYYGIRVYSKSEARSIKSEIETLEKKFKMAFPKKTRLIL